MSGRLGEVAARLDSTRQLGSVIAAIRAVAASRSQQALHALAAIRVYADTVGQAIAQVLASCPTDQATPAVQASPERLLVVALCAEQGFTGNFNERVLDVALPRAAAAHSRLLIVGDRGLMVAASRRCLPNWQMPMAAHADEVPALAERLADAVYTRLGPKGADRVLLVHGKPVESGAQEIAQRWLLPFDFARFPTRRPAGQAPLLNLPPAALLEQLAVEYVYAELCEVLMSSYAAENEARMQAMIAAHGNLERKQNALTSQYQRVRQEDITAEIVELSTSRL